MKIKEIVALALIGFAALSSDASVTLSWGTAAAPNRLYSDFVGGTLLTPASQLSFSSASFVQLIWDVGANGLDLAVASGNGISGLSDDQVVGTSWVGQGQISPAGRFLASLSENLAVGSHLYIRAWNAPSSNYAGTAADVSALVPVGASVRYGDSSTFYLTTQNPLTAPPPTESYLLTGGIATTVVAVPEPSTVALMLAGLGVLGFSRFRRK